jgi:hypothetical protein
MGKGSRGPRQKTIQGAKGQTCSMVLQGNPDCECCLIDIIQRNSTRISTKVFVFLKSMLIVFAAIPTF